ncbi:hypothetical protein [Planctomicrobium sp. SH664]|uniref:tetratricopeptide repeat protein n=1 Tax=Planctomicrobium sp. SH664 TaxID=3448125 RepID=UPI003F5C4B3B
MRFLYGLIGIAIVTVAVRAESGEGTSQRYFAGLRSRGLYVLAEEYAQTRLNELGLKPEQRFELHIELFRTLLEHGNASSGDQRKELWNAAERTLQSLAVDELTPEQHQQLQTQLALLPGEQGKTLAWNVTLIPEDELSRHAAVGLLLEGRDRLNELIRRTNGTPPAGDQSPPADNLSWLLQRAEFEVLAAELLPPGQERSDLLNTAAQELIGLLRSQTDNETTVAGHLLWAKAARLQGDQRKAVSVLENLPKAKLRKGDADRILAERARQELAQRQPDEAYRFLEPRLKSAAASDEVRAVAVEALIDLWQRAALEGDQQAQALHLQEARTQGAQASGRWHQFIAARLERQEEDALLGAELSTAIRKGRGAWQSGRTQEAIEEFGKAAMLAHRQGLPDRAAEFALTRASILLKIEQWAGAEATFQEIVANFPQHPKTAEADLLRIYAIGQQAEKDGADQAHRFTEALQQHTTAFPNSPTRWEAVWMLAAHAEQQARWPAAAGHYRTIPVDHARREAAELRVLQIDDHMLRRPASDPSGGEWKEHAQADARQIGRRFVSVDSPLTPQQGEILLRCAELLLAAAPQPDADEDRFLERLTKGNSPNGETRTDPAAAEPWRHIQTKATQLRVLSLAAQSRLGEARELLGKLRNQSPNELLAVLSGLTDLTGSIDPERRRELGSLQRLAVQEITLRRGELNAQQQHQLDLCTAEAHRASGDLLEAAKRYEALCNADPTNRRLLRELIRIQMELGEPVDLQHAQAGWRKLEKLEPAGSAAWIDARLHLIELTRDLKDSAGALKLLTVTRTLYPAMGSPELKARGDALWQELSTQKSTK